MIYLLEAEDLVSGCSDYALANILYIIQRIMVLVQIIAPILAILALSITVSKMLMNPDDKKGLSGIKNTIIALIVVFLLPFIINFSMSLLDNVNFNFAECWTKANDIHKQIYPDQHVNDPYTTSTPMSTSTSTPAKTSD